MSQKGVPPRPALPTPRIHTGEKRLIFCYDLVCPYAYIASAVLEQLASDYSTKVEFVPVLLSGLLALDAATREADAPLEEVVPTKAAFKRTSLMREAARHHVELHTPPQHPVNTVAAMRVLSAVEGAERVLLTHALFKAYWMEGKDISNESVIMQCITQCGIKAVQIDRERGKEALMDATHHAYDEGAFGVPTFFVHNAEKGHDGTMYFGVDRLMFVRAALGDATNQLLRVTSDPATPANPPTVEFFFDLTSAWSFLGWTQIKRFSHLCVLRCTPIVIGGIWKTTDTSPPTAYMGKNKLRYFETDLQDFSAWWREPFEVPSFFPAKAVVPNRLALAHPHCTDTLFRALWQQGRNVGEEKEAVAVLNEAGYDGAELMEKAKSAAVKAQLTENTQRAQDMGVFGVPSFVVQGTNGTTLLWGQDKIDTLLDILSGWKEETPAPLQSKL